MRQQDETPATAIARRAGLAVATKPFGDSEDATADGQRGIGIGRKIAQQIEETTADAIAAGATDAIAAVGRHADIGIPADADRAADARHNPCCAGCTRAGGPCCRIPAITICSHIGIAGQNQAAGVKTGDDCCTRDCVSASDDAIAAVAFIVETQVSGDRDLAAA